MSDSCAALQQGRVQELPIKTKKTKVRRRHFNYLCLDDAIGNTLLQQRTGKGIWQNLWEFPLIESDKHLNREGLMSQLDDFLDVEQLQEIIKYNDGPIIHKLSHQHLHTIFWMVRTDEILENGIPWSDVQKYPVPVLIAEFFAKIRTFGA